MNKVLLKLEEKTLKDLYEKEFVTPKLYVDIMDEIEHKIGRSVKLTCNLFINFFKTMWSYDWDSEDYEWENNLVVKDCNGNILSAWDTVAAIKDLKVKWWSDIKRWDKFKNIRLTDNIEEIESEKMVLRE